MSELHRITSISSQITRESDDNHIYELNSETHPNSNILIEEYNEPIVTVVDWGRSIFNNPGQRTKNYLSSLFPIAHWILHYNTKWAYGDIIAGITVGVVLVPQSMSYAQLAGLPAQYGLYSSFVGVFIYSFFATSKDVSIGPVAVMSLQVGKVIAKVQEKVGDDKYAPAEIATFLALICGGIAAGIGLLRLGFILEFISIPAVMGFMTGSAFSILTGQIPGLMGYNSLVNTRDSTYKVVINTLKHLPDTTIDAAFGLVCLFILYIWKFSTEYGQKRWPKYKLVFFYVQHLRNAIVLIVATAICWGVVHPELVSWRKNGSEGTFKPSINVLGTVPSGLRHVGVLKIPNGIIGDMASEIPVSTIILLLEHIAIAKSFGRVNDYKIIPDQELIAIGVNNLIGTFFNAYPSTGSFSRSALKNKCGVRTPLAGIYTGAVVLLALYALTEAFYYIPKATLSAVIIHAVSDLMANYKTTWSFWEISPLDFGIFIIAVLITVFSSIENGIYFAIAASGAVLLFRIAIPNGQFLGRVKVTEVINPIISNNDLRNGNNSNNINVDNKEVGSNLDNSDSTNSSNDDVEIYQVLSGTSNYNATKNKKELVLDGGQNSNNLTNDLLSKNPYLKFHTRWVPLNNKNINKSLNVQPPPPGVIVFKPVESFTYPNCSRQFDRVLEEVKKQTKRGQPYNYTDTGSRPWNDPGPLNWKLPFWKGKFGNNNNGNNDDEQDTRPVLRILHFDFSTVSSIDVTSIQSLIDLRKSLNKYADREVEFHFSGILSPWIRRGLYNAGFGRYIDENLKSNVNYYNVLTENDLELGNNSKYVPAVATDTPFFHLDIPDYE